VRACVRAAACVVEAEKGSARVGGYLRPRVWSRGFASPSPSPIGGGKPGLRPQGFLRGFFRAPHELRVSLPDFRPCLKVGNSYPPGSLNFPLLSELIFLFVPQITFVCSCD
jgi:hypothetical protein